MAATYGHLRLRSLQHALHPPHALSFKECEPQNGCKVQGLYEPSVYRKGEVWEQRQGPTTPRLSNTCSGMVGGCKPWFIFLSLTLHVETPSKALAMQQMTIHRNTVRRYLGTQLTGLSGSTSDGDGSSHQHQAGGRQCVDLFPSLVVTLWLLL